MSTNRQLQILELISMGKDIRNDYLRGNSSRSLKLRIFLSENIGLICGILLMFLLGKYGEQILNLSSFFHF